MNHSINKELLEAIQDSCADYIGETYETLFMDRFNNSPYLIGYYQCEQWLKQHDVSPFEAIAYVIEKEQEQFGETYLKPEDINSEKVVNLLTYFAAEEILYDYLSEHNLDIDDTIEGDAE